MLLFVVLLCFVQYGASAPIDPQATTATVDLWNALKGLSNTKDFIFGQEMPVTYKYKSGFTSADLTSSDVKSVTGDNPGLYGADFLYIFFKSTQEGDAHKAAAVAANNAGSVVSFDWHMYSRTSQTYGNDGSNTNLVKNIVNPSDTTGDRAWFVGQMDNIATVFKSFNFPVLFRPFHEMNGNWFWWGNQAAADYIALYQFTVTTLQSKGVHNLLYVWSPNQGANFWNYYPGNSYVDIVGFDGYEPGYVSYFTWNDFLTLCGSVTDFAATNVKIAAITETGARNDQSIESNTGFWTSVLNQIKGDAKCSKIAYLQTWINGGWEKPYTPYSGMSQSAAITDFVNFYNDANTFFALETKAYRASPGTPVPLPPPVATPVAAPTTAPVSTPMPPGTCTDIPPDQTYTCEQQVGWGKCPEAFMVGKCDISCGRCGNACTDIPPDQTYTCAQQVGWGKCGESFMVGKCDRSCGRCTPASPLPPPPVAVPVVVPVSTPTANPVATPAASPVAQPTANPVAQPTATPQASPVAQPTANPVAQPTATPQANPVATPTANPVAQPTANPVAQPTATPQAFPTTVPTSVPTSVPTQTPAPVEQPVEVPVAPPTNNTEPVQQGISGGAVAGIVIGALCGVALIAAAVAYALFGAPAAGEAI